jgi:hypothetical protein
MSWVIVSAGAAGLQFMGDKSSDPDRDGYGAKRSPGAHVGPDKREPRNLPGLGGRAGLALRGRHRRDRTEQINLLL